MLLSWHETENWLRFGCFELQIDSTPRFEIIPEFPIIQCEHFAHTKKMSKLILMLFWRCSNKNWRQGGGRAHGLLWDREIPCCNTLPIFFQAQEEHLWMLNLFQASWKVQHVMLWFTCSIKRYSFKLEEQARKLQSYFSPKLLTTRWVIWVKSKATSIAKKP